MADVTVLYTPIQASIAKAGVVASAFAQTFIDSVTFDASMSETHSGEVQVTDNPVERGIDVTDNIRPKPEKVTLDVRISNNPLNPSLVSSLNNTKRAAESFRVLRELRDAGTLVTLVTSLRTYDNMVIQQISVDRNSKTGQVLKAKIDLRQIIIADTATVPAPVKPSGANKNNAGKKPATDATDGQRTSLLKKGVALGSKLLGLN